MLHFVMEQLAMIMIAYACESGYCGRSWCPDRTLHQARKYIADAMGERYAEGVILNLEATWEESCPRTPLICFLSMGSDPTGAIENLAKRKGIGTYENAV